MFHWISHQHSKPSFISQDKEKHESTFRLNKIIISDIQTKRNTKYKRNLMTICMALLVFYLFQQ